MTSTGKTIAFLAASGVDEALMSAMQKLVSKQDIPVKLKVISTEKALIQTWSGTDWGYSLAVSQKVDSALSADFDAVIVSGPQRNLDKLATNPHSNRFIEGFHGAQKPIIAVSDAVNFVQDVLLEDSADHIMSVTTVDKDNAMDEAQRIYDFVLAQKEAVQMAA